MNPILEKRINDVILRINDVENLKWIVKDNNVEAISQNGPQCGIVALCMGLNYLNIKIDLDELMKEAIRRGFTKNGEMFDKYLEKLGNIYFENKFKIVNLGNRNDEINVLEKILKSQLVLIAYDCDFNFEPCNKKGLKAHWALITGFLIPDTNKQSLKIDCEKDEQDGVKIKIINQDKKLDESNLESLIKNYPQFYEQIYVICKHGKSKHSGVWSLKSLIESNRQLMIIDDDKCKVEEFVRPLDGNIQKGLSSKVLIFGY